MIISKNNNQIHKFAYPVLQRPVGDIQPMIIIFSLPQKNNLSCLFHDNLATASEEKTLSGSLDIKNQVDEALKMI